MADKKSEITTRVVRCPTCRKSTRYDATNPHRPFCSARCKNEDIIGWAEQSFRIPGKPSEEGEDAVRPESTHDADE